MFGEVQFPCCGQARLPVLSERIDAENGFTTHYGCHSSQKSRPSHYQIPDQWTPLDCNIEVFGDANFAGVLVRENPQLEESRCGQFVKSSSKTMGVLALSSGESELAAVVRAATEGLGLQF